jgi:beta-lactamase class A
MPLQTASADLPIWSRRALILHGACLLAVAEAATPGLADAQTAVLPLDDMETRLQARIGVAAIDTASGMRLAHRADERFAMCSTFKWLLAAAVLAQNDHDGQVLERRLPYGPGDLLPHSPVSEAHVAEGSLPIRELCRAAVEASDNTAANGLLQFIGGPGALTRFLRQIGDRESRLDRTEPELNTNLRDDPRDTTTPAAMIGTMQTLLCGTALSDASRRLLLGWLRNCQTGLERLRAGVPATWTAGDKTGTGERGAVNDVAILWPPRRPPVLIAAYFDGSRAAQGALNQAHARIGAKVCAAFS